MSQFNYDVFISHGCSNNYKLGGLEHHKFLLRAQEARSLEDLTGYSQQGCAPSRGLRGEPSSWSFYFLEDARTPWLGAMPRSTL